MATKEYPPLVMPDNITRTQVTIHSEGFKLDGDLYRPKDLGGDRKAPAVVLSHGWGGSKTTPERYAAKFASAGMVALTFSYAGWFGSEGPARDFLDPMLQLANYRSALDWIEGEPNVDVNRIGAWGTSFGGGIVIYTAAHDDRIKAIFTQVGALAPFGPARAREKAKARATEVARGKDPVGVDTLAPLAGSYHLGRFSTYRPVDFVDRVKVPTSLIDAGNEELFDIKEHSGRAYDVLKRAGVPTEYEIVPGIDHYGIYFEGFDRGSEAALAWFKKYL